MKPQFKIKINKNGLKYVSVKIGDSRAFTIQTNGNLKETHRLGLGADIEKEVREYVQQHGTDHQKQLLNIQVWEWPIMWNGEEVDTATSFKDARYLRNEYNLAFKGGVTIGKKRRV